MWMEGGGSEGRWGSTTSNEGSCGGRADGRRLRRWPQIRFRGGSSEGRWGSTTTAQDSATDVDDAGLHAERDASHAPVAGEPSAVLGRLVAEGVRNSDPPREDLGARPPGRRICANQRNLRPPISICVHPVCGLRSGAARPSPPRIPPGVAARQIGWRPATYSTSPRILADPCPAWRNSVRFRQATLDRPPRLH